ncbi:MAG: hypothetical protein WBA10_05380 [Elainellaceae cyanobacterium]
MPNRFNPATIRQFTQQPSWWAAVSSLGFHGLVFLGLSLLPAPPSLGDDIDSPRTVSVFEFSASDTARLPNFLDLETSLPPLPDAPPPIPSIPNLKPEAYEFDLGPNIVESQRDFEISPRSSATYDFSDLFSNLPTPNVLNRRPPISVPRQAPTPAPIEPASPEVVDETPPSNAPASTPDAGTAADLQQPNGTAPEQPGPASGDTTSEAPQVARASENPKPEAIQLSEEQQAVYDRLYTYSTNGTSGSEAQVAATAWLTEEVGRDISEVDTLRNFLTLSVDYPTDACAIGSAEGSLAASYGVVLDDSGAITGDPVLIRSSGYGVLNLEGRAAVEDADSFDASGPKIVRVEFVYSDATCSAAEAIAREQASPNNATQGQGE